MLFNSSKKIAQALPKFCANLSKLSRTNKTRFVRRENIRAKIRARDVIPSLLTVLQCFMQSECETRAIAAPGQTTLKKTKKWRSLIVFRRDGVSWTRNPYLFIRETIYRRRITRDFFALPLPTRNSPSCNSGKINDDRDE